MTSVTPKVYKTTIFLSQDAIDALRCISTHRRCSMAHVIRQAISTQKFLQDAVDRDAKIIIESNTLWSKLNRLLLNWGIIDSRTFKRRIWRVLQLPKSVNV